MAAKPFRLRDDAGQRFQSVLAAVRAIRGMPDVVLESHKRRLLRSCLWQLTQSQGWGKYNLRYATAAARRLFEADRKELLHHEHVYTQKRMIDRLLTCDVDLIEEILKTACGCLVTRNQHKKLSKPDCEADGWERYQRAGFRIFDRLDRRIVSFDELQQASA